jgi:hypothetical protein
MSFEKSPLLTGNYPVNSGQPKRNHPYFCAKNKHDCAARCQMVNGVVRIAVN